MIYDAGCRLCWETVRRLHRLGWFGRLAFLPPDDPRIGAWYPDLRRTELEKYVHVVDRRGRRHKGARAVR